MASAIKDYQDCICFSTRKVLHLAYEMRSAETDRWTLLSHDNTEMLDALCAYLIVAKGCVKFKLEPNDICHLLRDYNEAWHEFLKNLPDNVRREAIYGQVLDALDRLNSQIRIQLTEDIFNDISLISSTYNSFVDLLSELGETFRVLLNGPISTANIQPPKLDDTEDCKRFLYELAQQLIKDTEINSVTNMSEAAEYMRACKAKEKYFELCRYAQEIQKKIQRNSFYNYIREGKPSKSAARSMNQVDAKTRFKRETTRQLKGY